MRRRLSGVGAVAVVLMMGAMPPFANAGKEERPQRVSAFWLPATNGYRMVGYVIPASERDPGRIALLLSNRRSFAFYLGLATVTRRTVEANLGKLGRISVTRVPTDRMKTVRRGCRRKFRKQVRAQRYEGQFEFRGEERFTEVSSTSAPLDYPTSCDGGKPGTGRENRVLPGARLNVERQHGERLVIELDVIQPRPGAKTAVAAQINEYRRGMYALRGVHAWAGASALRYDNLLRTATVRPPAPFSGHGTYRRSAPRARQWTGNLRVDFPGRSNVRLTGRSFNADLEHPTR